MLSRVGNPNDGGALMIWWALGIACLAIVLAPFLHEAMRRPMDAIAQAEAPGAFAILSAGATHYRLEGPEGGPLVVLIHGLGSPCAIWDGVVPGLNAMGFRTLRYDLYGRGYSDRAPAPHDEGFFVTQLDALLAALGLQGPLSLMGFSMGGSIATAFAARDADRVEYLALIAPTGMAFALPKFERVMRDWPGLGDWMVRWLGARRSAEQIARAPWSPAFRTLLRAELHTRGYLPATLAGLRGLLRDEMEEEHRRLARAAVPVMALWGGRDMVIPQVAAEVLADWNPDVQHFVLDDAGHALPHTHADGLIAAFAQFTDDYL